MNNIFLKQTIERAIKEQRYLKIDYVSKKMEITTDRILEPIDIKKDKEGNMEVLVATDHKKRGMRTFNFEGIQKIAVVSPLEAYAQAVS